MTVDKKTVIVEVWKKFCDVENFCYQWNTQKKEWAFLGYFALKCDVYSCAVTVGTEKNISVNFISFQVFVHVNEMKSCENVVMK